ncbi:hypothetical protein [Acutalibacter sp. 1XD8-36]|uniref:hypothetical protein n=1 Tax=Acutalibacter sp. 1XD8-36 TaxID=2320852 RepID=UPI003FA490B4
MSGYDVLAYKAIKRDRWNPWEDKPIKDANEFFRLQRKLVNSDESRSVAVLELLEKHPREVHRAYMEMSMMLGES